jgi:alpha-ketoglutarate-dependent taurine dioxygenase
MGEVSERTTAANAGIVIRPLEADIERFREALNTFKVLVYRDQDPTKEQLIGFSRRWGTLGDVMSNKGPDGLPTGKHPDPTAKRWHTDRSYMRRPAMTTITLRRRSANGRR